jgi:AraC-like DNA-binding protein
MDAADPKREIQLLYRPGLIAIRGESLATESHRHHALQVAASTGDPLHLESAGVQLAAKILIVPPDVDHKLVARECLILLLEPEGVAAHAILGQLGDPAGPVSLDGRTDTVPLAEPLSWSLVDALLETMGAPRAGSPVIDERLGRVVAWIDDVEQRGRWDELSFARACETAALSESRFRHLLSEQFGIGWRAYVLWRRLISALQYAVARASLTDAAFHAGFADLPHLSRACKQMFGMTPREILLRARPVDSP